jgi:hypothetical protein
MGPLPVEAAPTPARHVCGVCGDEWLTEDEYLNHVCPKTNVTPADPAHQGPEFAKVQEAALQRGLDRAQAENNTVQVSRQEAAIAGVQATPTVQEAGHVAGPDPQPLPRQDVPPVNDPRVSLHGRTTDLPSSV